MFSDALLLEVMTFLGLGPGYLTTVQNNALFAFETFGEDVVIKVERIVSELNSLESTISTEAIDRDSNIKKLDVIEWEVGGETTKRAARIETLKGRLAALMSLEDIVDSLNPGYTRVVKV